MSVKVFSGHELTSCQDKAIKMLSEVLEKRSTELSLVTGSAGVGKTYMMQLVTELTHLKITCIAPTHKAVGQLLKVVPDGIECSTIHKFLSLRLKNDNNTGEKVTYQDEKSLKGNLLLAETDIVFVDECSMVDSVHLKFIQEDIENSRRIYIMLGDSCQLPPVSGDNGELSPVFKMMGSNVHVDMTTIVRQAQDNPIIKLATEIRDYLKGSKVLPVLETNLLEDGRGVQFVSDKNEFLKLIEECITDDNYYAEYFPDNCRVTSFTNEKVHQYNLQCRKFLGKNADLPFEAGDVVTFNQAMETPEGNDILFNNGDEVKVKTEPVLTKYKDINCYEFEIESGNMYEGKLRIVSDKYRKDFKAKMDANADRCIRTATARRTGSPAPSDYMYWNEFYELKNSFVDLRPHYSLTTHKSQGSTFTNVFIDFDDIFSIRDKDTCRRSFYVALTRATDRVVIYKSK